MTSTRRKLVAGGAAAAATAFAAVLALTAPAAAGPTAPMADLPTPPTTPTVPSCGQPTHVWAATPGGSLAGGATVNIPAGSSIYLTGVVWPGSSVTYHFHYASGVEQVRTTTESDWRCVVHHEDNQYVTAGDHEQIVVTADYYPWEITTKPPVYGEFVGTINLI